MEQESHRPNYLAVFVALVMLMAIEVTVSYLPFADATLQVVILASGSLSKALLVMAYYMHLRFDSRWYVYIVGFALLFGILLVLTFAIS